MPEKRIPSGTAFVLSLLLVFLAACGAADTAAVELPTVTAIAPALDSKATGTGSACPATEPVLATPPEDAAVLNEPAPGYYFLNADRSIWASAPDPQVQAYAWRATKEGVKVGWFRPAGAALEITGRRLDGESPPLLAEASCCYPTRFQASGLYFPTAGCWEVSARAADSELTFVVRIEP